MTPPPLRSRKASHAAGDPRYYTGKPCPAGHDCERYTSTYGCVECAAAAKRAWYADPDNAAREIAKAAARYDPDRTAHLARARRVSDVPARILRDARQRADKLGIYFDPTLTPADVPPVPACCPVFPWLVLGTGGNVPSLDRYTPALGYRRGNFQVISWRANQCKGTYGLAQLVIRGREAREALAAGLPDPLTSKGGKRGGSTWRERIALGDWVLNVNAPANDDTRPPAVAA